MLDIGNPFRGSIRSTRVTLQVFRALKFLAARFAKLSQQISRSAVHHARDWESSVAHHCPSIFESGLEQALNYSKQHSG